MGTADPAPDRGLLTALRDRRLLAIVRGTDPGACVRTAVTLVEEGVTLLEVSLTSTEAFAVLRSVTGELGEAARVGAGTVLTGDDAHGARDAGAAFVVTPALGEGVTAAVGLGLPVLAGAMTPTEVLAAVNAGATAVKLFPAEFLGPGYVGALRGPFPDVSFVPVGGVGRQQVIDYLRAGVLAVGAGGPLAGDAPNGGDLTALRSRARDFLAAVREGTSAT
jgi:2-dehydro-3-deoxyphosphogluconate aldolase / (4S)-4-hydroxy-2-oxoglutarate aldolase